MSTTVYSTRTSDLWLDERGILHSRSKPGAAITLDDAKAEVAAGRKATGDRRVPLLVDLTAIASITREARQYFAAQELTIAQAIVTRSSVGRVIGNFFLGLNRPRFPTKLFASEEAALEWLAQFLDAGGS